MPSGEHPRDRPGPQRHSDSHVPGILDSDIAAGTYCNEAFARPGFLGLRKTATGKTAKIIVGSPSDTRRKGIVLEIDLTVRPDLVESEVETAYTYTMTVNSVGTADREIDDLVLVFCASVIVSCEHSRHH